MWYIVALIIMTMIYFVTVYLMKYMKNTKLWSFVFCSAIFLLYISLVIKIYKDVGPYDWNFRNTLPVANVSPFMFGIIPILLILPRKIKNHLLLLISLLTFGMFFSVVMGCVFNAIRNYKFHLHFMLDYFAHILLSLFGIYLIRSRRVEFNFKNCVISSSVILAVAVTMMGLNVIFDTSFFGLSLNGKHNIYNNVLVSNSYLSALLYFTGLIVVLALGGIISKIFNKESLKIE